MRVQGKRPRAEEMREGRGRVMFEYVDFLHCDFRGINLSNVRRYIRVQGTTIVVSLFLCPRPPIQSNRPA